LVEKFEDAIKNNQKPYFEKGWSKKTREKMADKTLCIKRKIEQDEPHLQME